MVPRSMVERIRKVACIDVFRSGCLLLAAYFFYVFHSIVGFPPIVKLDPSSITFLVLFVFFLLLPSAKTLRLGKWFEYEARIDEIKGDVEQFKSETRQILSVQSSLINTVTNSLNQSINITLPGPSEIQEANEQLNSTIENPTPTEELEEELEEFLVSGGSDLNFALAKLRMELERELRRILDKRLNTSDPTKMKGRFLAARSLFREFVRAFPQYNGMHGSFDFILKICNAAIHGQDISEGYSQEAFYMGLKMLDELRKIDSDGGTM